MSASRLKFQVLGPVAVSRDGLAVPITRPQQRRLLGLLLVNRGRAVSDDRILDVLWPDHPPSRPQVALHTALSRLRTELGNSDVIARRDAGYELVAEPGAVDADVFESLIGDAGHDDAQARLTQALQLWIGDEAYADIRYEDFAAAEADRLEELRIKVEEDLFAARLEHGGAEDLIPALLSHVRKHPLREAGFKSLMLALYQTGRVAEALRAFRTVSHNLAERGLEPTKSLVDLEYAILMQDPRLSAAADQTRPNNLPTRVASLVGRDAELDAIGELQKLHRLVTVVGPGGVGKTTVTVSAARTIASERRLGCWLIDLHSVQSANELTALVAAELASFSHQATSSTPDESALAAIIGMQDLLLVLDSCERVPGAVADLAIALLEQCPNLTVVATSRQRLGVAGEAVLELDPLPVGDPIDAVADEREMRVRSPALSLFLDRALAKAPESKFRPEYLSEAQRLCRQLDGLPLAIELAAARTPSLTPGEINRQLDERFGVLGTLAGGAHRHRTLEDAIAWSYDMLAEDEQLCLQRLATNEGPFTLEEAACLCSLDTAAAAVVVNRLSDRSLIQTLPEHLGAARFTMLETIKAFSRGRAAIAGRSDQHAARHAACYHALALQAEPHIRFGEAQLEWMGRIKVGLSDIEKAVATHVAMGQAEAALEIAASAAAPCDIYGVRSRGYPIVRDALAAAGDEVYATTPKAHFVAAVLSPPVEGSTFQQGAHHIEQAVRTAQLVGDRETQAVAVGLSGIFQWIAGDTDGGLDAFHEGKRLARGVGEGWATSGVDLMTGIVLQAIGRTDAAIESLESAVAASVSLCDAITEANARVYLASALKEAREYSLSADAYETAFLESERHGFLLTRNAATLGLALTRALGGSVDDAVATLGRLLPELQPHVFSAVGHVFVIGDRPDVMVAAFERFGQIGQLGREERPSEVIRLLLETFEATASHRNREEALADARQALADLGHS